MIIKNKQGTPLEGYKYKPCGEVSLFDWYELASYNKECVLPDNMTRQLEFVYRKKEYTAKEHKENIEILYDISMELTYGWTSRERESSNMNKLVYDYQKFYNLNNK